MDTPRHPARAALPLPDADLFHLPTPGSPILQHSYIMLCIFVSPNLALQHGTGRWQRHLSSRSALTHRAAFITLERRLGCVARAQSEQQVQQCLDGGHWHSVPASADARLLLGPHLAAPNLASLTPVPAE